MNRLSISVLLLAMCALCASAAKSIDKKFFRQTAEKVWAMNLPQFNPHANLTDSLYANRSAVYIARYYGVELLHNEKENQAKALSTGLSYTNAIDGYTLDRRMVKILDASALEEFGEFSVKPPVKHESKGWVYAENKPAFGARIHKPDGRVIDVDMEKAVTVTHGKKSNEVKEFKIAIEGLEVGDVLEYFYYTETMLDEISAPDMTITFLRGYPTLDFTVDILVSADFAFEYMNYNGAPDFVKDLTSNPRHLTLNLKNVDAVEEKLPYFSAARQTPYINYYVLNNRGRLQYVPSTARLPGVRKIVYPQFIGDVAQSIADAKLPNKFVDEAAAITRDWMKAHPAATQPEIYDAAWLSLRYVDFRDEVGASNRQMAKAYVRLLEKIEAPDLARVGIAASHYMPTVRTMINYQDPQFFATVAGRYYIPNINLANELGSFPASYEGEEIAYFDADPDIQNLKNTVRYLTLPKSKAKDNKMVSHLYLSLDPANDESTLISDTITYDGSWRTSPTALSALVDDIHALEQFLGVKEAKRTARLDAAAQRTDAREEADEYLPQIWGSKEAKVESFSFVSLGIDPADESVVLTARGSMPGAVSSAGRNMLVNVGRFIGIQTEPSPSERTRTVSVIRNAETYRTEIIFAVPEGYAATAESVEALKRNVNSGAASFFVDAAIEGSNVKITIIERYPQAVYPAESWPLLLKIQDACIEFTKANIVLKPV